MIITDVWQQNNFTYAYCSDVGRIPNNPKYAVVDGEQYVIDAFETMISITGIKNCALRFKGNVDVKKAIVKLI